MKACVVSPPIRDFYITPHRLSGLGARTVHEILLKNNFDSRYYNFPLTGNKITEIPLPEELNHLIPFIIPRESGPLSFFTGYKEFGPCMKSCAGSILEFNPQIVFISCFAFAYAAETIDLARELKEMRPGVIISAGGAGVSVYPQYFSRYGFIDYLFTGEAEMNLPSFLDKIRNDGQVKDRIPGVIFTGESRGEHGSSASLTGDDEIEPVIGMTLETKNRVHISMSVSRGCTKSCRFCSNHLTHGKKFRKIPIRKIIDKIKKLPAGKKILLNFEDDNLLHDREYFISLLREIRGLRKDLLFSAENGLDYMLMDDGLALELIALGFRQFNLSLGAMSGPLLMNEKRSASLKRLERIINIAGKLNIPSIIYFICGLRDDTPQNTCDTLLYLSRLKAIAGISPFYAVPGIHGFEERGIFSGLSPRLCAGSSAWPWNRTLSTKEIVTAFRLARYINFLKKKKHTEIEADLLGKIKKDLRLFTIINSNGKKTIAPVEGIDGEMAGYLLREVYYP